MQKPKRANKSKKDIVSDMQLVNAANRRRSLISDIIFPYLVEVDDTIGYSKVFLQAMSGLVNGEFDKTRKTTTIGHLHDTIVKRLGEIFKTSDPEQKKEYKRYLGLIERMHDISVDDFSYAAELPRYIDGYIAKTKEKESIKTIDITKILG